ncbi:MAG: hypothetical protein MJA27_07830, partial [Pseudanabaenales cyanobacterium]|nr:hypothetical protein [Pseudanabaenales cyanobacterium]
IDSDSDGDTKLYYLVGFDPTKKTKFSKASFDYRDSFAGWVISRSTDRSRVYSYVRDGENSFQGKKIPFHFKIPTGPYKSIVACAIQPLMPARGTSPQMVLCIDCSKENFGIFSNRSADREYIESVLLFLSNAFAIAQASMNVPASRDKNDKKSIANWIRETYYDNSN